MGGSYYLLNRCIGQDRAFLGSSTFRFLPVPKISILGLKKKFYYILLTLEQKKNEAYGFNLENEVEGQIVR